jgi:hypothetical protein
MADWQRTYREFAAQSARYLSRVLRDEVPHDLWESKGRTEDWSLDGEIDDAWEHLKTLMAHLDAINREEISV